MNIIILKLTTNKYHITLLNIITNEKNNNLIYETTFSNYNHLFLNNLKKLK